MNAPIINSISTVSGCAGGTTGEAEVVLLVKGKADTVEAVRLYIEQAVVTPATSPRRNRKWDSNLLSLVASGQDRIERGDIVRSYDFPGSRDDCYVEGVAKTVEEDRVLIHVTREVWNDENTQVDRFEVWGPLGVSALSGSPCVFLQAKRVVKS